MAKTCNSNNSTHSLRQRRPPAAANQDKQQHRVPKRTPDFKSTCSSIIKAGTNICYKFHNTIQSVSHVFLQWKDIQEEIIDTGLAFDDCISETKSDANGFDEYFTPKSDDKQVSMDSIHQTAENEHSKDSEQVLMSVDVSESNESCLESVPGTVEVNLSECKAVEKGNSLQQEEISARETRISTNSYKSRSVGKIGMWFLAYMIPGTGDEVKSQGNNIEAVAYDPGTMCELSGLENISKKSISYTDGPVLPKKAPNAVKPRQRRRSAEDHLSQRKEDVIRYGSGIVSGISKKAGATGGEGQMVVKHMSRSSDATDGEGRPDKGNEDKKEDLPASLPILIGARNKEHGGAKPKVPVRSASKVSEKRLTVVNEEKSGEQEKNEVEMKKNQDDAQTNRARFSKQMADGAQCTKRENFSKPRTGEERIMAEEEDEMVEQHERGPSTHFVKAQPYVVDGSMDMTYSALSKHTSKQSTGYKTGKSVHHENQDDNRHNYPRNQRPPLYFPDENKLKPFEDYGSCVSYTETEKDLGLFLRDIRSTSSPKGLVFQKEFDLTEMMRVRSAGRGSYGKVWECQVGHARVALKQIHLNNFRNEEALALFNNPSDVFAKFHAILYNNGVVYLIMEFLPETLNSMLYSKEEFNKDWLREFLFKLLCVLLQLEKGDLCHGDIKAENIGFTKDGKIKLLDTGTVWKLGQYFKTKPGGFTPEFMSPQMCHPTKHLTESNMFHCDIYSAALTFLYIITKKSQCQFFLKQDAHTNIKDYLEDKYHHFNTLKLITEAAETRLICPDLTLLLQRMLTYELTDRITLTQCIAHTVFTDLREKAGIPAMEGDSWQRCCSQKEQKITELEEENKKLRKQVEARRDKDSGFSSNTMGSASFN